MAKNEFRDLFNKFNSDGVTVPTNQSTLSASSIDFDSLTQNLGAIEPRESPDGIFLNGDIAYMLEHFQISPYGAKNGSDELQRANGRSYKSIVKEFPTCDEVHMDLNSSLLNLKRSFSASLSKHMGQYHNYLQNAASEYPGKEYKFIIVVQDNSEAIINEDGISILDIKEFVQEILSYQQIDGVVVYTSDPRGPQIIAKDRIQMQNDIDSQRLLGLDCCEMVSTYIEMNATLSHESKSVKDRMRHRLISLDDSFGLEDKGMVLLS